MKKRVVTVYCILILAFILIKCGQSNTTENLVIKSEAFKIKINEFLLSDYFQYSLYDDNDTLIISAYNYLMNKIDFFDLKNRSFISSLELETGGPNAISQLLSQYILNKDSLLLFCQNEIVISNYTGQIINKIPINNRAIFSPMIDSKFDFNNYSLAIINNYFDPQFSNSKIYLLKDKKNNTPFEADFFSENFIAELDLENLQVNQIPVYYSSDLKTPGNVFEYLWYPVVNYSDNKIIYSFLYTPDLYLFDLESNRLTQAMNKESHIEKSSPMQSNMYDRPEYYSNLQPAYFKIHYDNKNNLYWRLYYNRKKDHESSRQLSLLIYNQNLEIIFNKPVEDGHKLFPVQAFMSNGNLFIPVKGEFLNEVYLGFVKMML